MRLSKTLMVIPVLALLTVSCAHRRGGASHHGEPCKAGKHAMAMAHACGPESCTYKSRCFSPGAVSSNDGVCQACSGGKWVDATGCSECGKHCDDDGCKMKGKKSGPCHHGGSGHSKKR